MANGQEVCFLDRHGVARVVVREGIELPRQMVEALSLASGDPVDE
jgi:hypothetical protein